MKYCVWEWTDPDNSVVIEADNPEAAVLKLMKISHANRGIVDENQHGIMTQNGWTYKVAPVPDTH